MSQAAETLDGWYSLHLFYAVDWPTLRLVPDEDRIQIVQEFHDFLDKLASVRDDHNGDHALYNITGQKPTSFYGFYVLKCKN